MDGRRYGTVLVRDHYFTDEDGNTYQGITGDIEICKADDVLGFEIGHRDSNWVLLIHGDQTELLCPGCAVLNVLYHPKQLFTSNVAYKVIP